MADKKARAGKTTTKYPGALGKLMEKHRRAAGTWAEGEPLDFFEEGGLPCVRYESGAWWHYDVKKGTWY